MVKKSAPVLSDEQVSEVLGLIKRDDIPSEVRKSPSFGVEVDAMPGGFVCSGSMKAKLDPLQVKQAFELSTKCAPAEAFDVAAQTKAFLAEHDVDLAGEQQTKTKAALDFFAGELHVAEAQPS